MSIIPFSFGGDSIEKMRPEYLYTGNYTIDNKCIRSYPEGKFASGDISRIIGDSFIYNNALKDIKSHSSLWNSKGRSCAFEAAHQYRSTRIGTSSITSLFDCEIVLFNNGFQCIEFSALNAYEPYRIYKRADVQAQVVFGDSGRRNFTISIGNCGYTVIGIETAAATQRKIALSVYERLLWVFGLKYKPVKIDARAR